MYSHDQNRIFLSETVNLIFTDINFFFQSVDVNLSNNFLTQVQGDIYRLAKSHLEMTPKGTSITPEEIETTIESNYSYDLFEKARFIIFDLIKYYEPPEVINDFLKTSSKFKLLIYFSYHDFLRKTVKKNTKWFHL